jgi:hypothetical protein
VESEENVSPGVRTPTERSSPETSSIATPIGSVGYGKKRRVRGGERRRRQSGDDDDGDDFDDDESDAEEAEREARGKRRRSRADGEECVVNALDGMKARVKAVSAELARWIARARRARYVERKGGRRSGLNAYVAKWRWIVMTDESLCVFDCLK